MSERGAGAVKDADSAPPAGSGYRRSTVPVGITADCVIPIVGENNWRRRRPNGGQAPIDSDSGAVGEFQPGARREGKSNPAVDLMFPPTGAARP